MAMFWLISKDVLPVVMDVGMGQTAATGLATVRRIVATISRDDNMMK
jgi:hypothetical protein